MTDIFVSYASEDRDRIEALVDVLKGEGWSVWWDRDLVVGASFEEKIQEALNSAKCVVVAWSKHAVDSGWCRDEAREGLARKALVPLCIDDVQPPLGFRSAQTASMIGWPEQPGELDRLVAGVRQCVNAETSAPIDGITTPVRGDRKRSIWRHCVQLAAAAVFLGGIAWWYWDKQNEPHDQVLTAPRITPSVAVLPFANMSNDPDQVFFSDGITEDILNTLARDSSLSVRPRSSAFALKDSGLDLGEIGTRLNVTHVLDGSVRRSGSRIRVTVELGDVAADRTIWSNRYDREMTDIFAVQDSIAREVVQALNAQFLQRIPPRAFVSEEANEAFYLGRYHLGQLALHDANRWLRRATELNPANADAWGDLAYLNLLMTFSSRVPNTPMHRLERNEFIKRALAADPNHPNALGVRAYFDFVEVRDYQTAVNDLVMLVTSNPNDAQAHLLLTYVLTGLGRPDLVERVARQTLELDPLSTGAQSMRVYSLLESGSGREAQRAFNSSPGAQISPNVAFEVAWALRDTAAMQTALEQPGLAGHPNRLVYAAVLAYVQGEDVDSDEVERSPDQYQSYVIRSRLSIVKGRFADAVNHWRQAVAKGEPQSVLGMTGRENWRSTFPDFYAHPKYRQMLVDFGLDAESRDRIEVPELPF